MIESAVVTQQQLIAELSKSPHGKLSEYVPLGLQGAAHQSEFYAHLIAYNERKGQIRDSKVAMPIISLACGTYPDELVDNSLAHLVLLSPKDLLRGLRFALEIRTPGHMKLLKRTISRYLRVREQDWGRFTRTALQHKGYLRELYALTHTKRPPAVGAILFGGEGSKRKGGFTPAILPKGSVFNTVAHLGEMSPNEAAGHILNKKVPFLTALGAIGWEKAQQHSVLMLALMSRMTSSEFITHTKDLERMGVRNNPALRSAYEEALQKASTSKKVTFKTTKAIEALEQIIGDDNPVREKLRALQEKQIDQLGGIEGSWAVLADSSGSMQHSIELAKMIAGTLARMVKGVVKLVFFANNARGLDVTGKSYDEIRVATKGVIANGGTSIGAGLECILDNKVMVDAICITTDGAENCYPRFATVYQEYCKWLDRKVPVYIYLVEGDVNKRHIQDFFDTLKAVDIVPQVFDLTKGQVDFYSLPNLIQTMRVNRYSLVDEILNTPLLSLDQVLGERRHA